MAGVRCRVWVLARCWRDLANVERVQSFLTEYVAEQVERHQGGPGGKKQKWAMRDLIGLALRLPERQRVRICG